MGEGRAVPNSNANKIGEGGAVTSSNAAAAGADTAVGNDATADTAQIFTKKFPDEVQPFMNSFLEKI